MKIEVWCVESGNLLAEFDDMGAAMEWLILLDDVSGLSVGRDNGSGDKYGWVLEGELLQRIHARRRSRA